MKILHYTLGLPPYRTGGLTQYSVDLMRQQVSQRQQVFLLFPGHFTLSGNTKMTPIKSYEGITVFELINPLPVSLLGGISNPGKFTKDVSPSTIYINFLRQLKPGIIHIHTLMGLHKEFFKAAKVLKIKLIFTTHDYYGICPKVNLIDSVGEICHDYNNGESCDVCNQYSYSFPLIAFMQSRTYRLMKDSRLLKKIRSNKKKKIMLTEEKNQSNNQVLNGEGFLKLRQYYLNIFEEIDHFHFNSSTTKEQFLKYVNITGNVISISNSSIKDNRQIKDFSSIRPLRISFVGPLEKYKGFPLLIESLQKLLTLNETNWRLNVHGNNTEVELEGNLKDYITFNGRYKPEELNNIYKQTDILVIPSIWKETFGFIGLEALSHGVPTLVSEHVGFKDLINDQETGILFKANSNCLAKEIQKIIHNREILKKINKTICEMPLEDLGLIESHQEDIQRMYEKILGERK